MLWTVRDSTEHTGGLIDISQDMYTVHVLWTHSGCWIVIFIDFCVDC